jgi:guanosine-3',5'-bis(diphosphate) 3'-pyrophosphohydrolase
LRAIAGCCEKLSLYLNEGDAKLIKRAFHHLDGGAQGYAQKIGRTLYFSPAYRWPKFVWKKLGWVLLLLSQLLLHDVVEDTDIQLKDLERIFGTKTTPALLTALPK